MTYEPYPISPFLCFESTSHIFSPTLEVVGLMTPSLPNPTSGHMRLSELLEEQQEPFQLDVYLLQNGYSTRILTSEHSIKCWPGGKPCRRLSSIGFKRRIGVFWRCLLTELVYGKGARKALHWESKTSGDGRLGTTSDSSINGRHQRRCMETGSLKQLSTVSVLQLHSCDHSKEEHHSMTSSIDTPPSEASSNLGELLKPASSPSSLKSGKVKKVMSQLDRLLADCVREVEDRMWDAHGFLRSEMRQRAIQEEVLSWGRQRGDGCSITKLMKSDLLNSRFEWSSFQPHVREIGIEIEATIFEEIREEAILATIGFYCTKLSSYDHYENH